MPRIDASSATCRIFTFKEGILSAVAHDLELAVQTFTLELEDDYSAIEGTFDVGSIRVLHAVVDGRPSPSSLSAKDRSKIESNVLSDVFPKRRGHEARFVSSSITAVDSGWELRGSLTLAGRTRDITVPVHRDGGKVVGEVSIHQPDFGIKPFSAMLGTLKVQADLKVRVEVPLPE